MTHPLLTVDELARRQADADVRIVDVRWYLNGPRGRDAYEASHIAGAVFLDVNGDLADPVAPGDPARPGRHPLPSMERFASVCRSVEVGPSQLVVAYDDAGGSIAARLWWMLHRLGHPGGAAVLDGGWQAWNLAGLPVESGPSPARLEPPASIELPRESHAHPFTKVDRDHVKARLGDPSVLLLDARAPERYEGRVEPIDARAGHIPGAKNAPFVGNLIAPGGRFLAPDQLRARYESLGVHEASEVIVYCGSGVTACHDILALTMAGLGASVSLYEGSWSDWSSDTSLPIEP